MSKPDAEIVNRRELYDALKDLTEAVSLYVISHNAHIAPKVEYARRVLKEFEEE